RLAGEVARTPARQTECARTASRACAARRTGTGAGATAPLMFDTPRVATAVRRLHAAAAAGIASSSHAGGPAFGSSARSRSRAGGSERASNSPSPRRRRCTSPPRSNGSTRVDHDRDSELPRLRSTPPRDLLELPRDDWWLTLGTQRSISPANLLTRSF